MDRKQIDRITAVFTTLLLFITACTTTEQPAAKTAVSLPATAVPPTPTTIVEEIVLPDLGQAPEITNDTWINTDVPVTLASQQGKVVLIEFWTFG